MKIKLKVWHWILFSVLFLFILTNPSSSNFKEYSDDLNVKQRKAIYQRRFNGLLFSIYEKRVVTWDDYNEQYETAAPEKYVGILKNFIPLK
ncbi:hypothetical protein ESB13_05440 [Filimonas effusa]|uniref:Uncharacterized protein n=2 Tax=Filimonas effusa TaxID=2508721 RepID=A0A4Q1DA43_9BACT|nr:hypothetical protein ESB13_05440 [Filimonas effusa]